jgi:tRNA nucleotidyltransferase/poly(A) polymerase
MVERACAEAGLRSIPVGKSFGVVVVLCDGVAIEVATFRRDGRSQDARHPDSVAYTQSAEEDVARRDFTINALLFDPLVGEAIDHVGGLGDLRRRCLRTVGEPERRFSEDRLRVLRALRFAAQLGLTIEPATWTGLCAAHLRGLSAERLMQEWFKGLCGPHRGTWLNLLCTSGQINGLCPVLASLSPEGIEHLTVISDRLGTAGPACAAASWLVPCGDDGLAWLARQPLAHERVTRIRWLVEHARSAELLVSGPRPALRRVLQHAAAAELVQLLHADPKRATCATLLQEAYDQERAQGPWQPLVRAQDLLVLGCAQGPLIGRLLIRIEDAQLEGVVASRQEGLGLAARLIAEAAGRPPA